ncbi:hypothetical protein [Escherichia coli]|uniref:hypothetical protein n=1 Tax=Escherichia coli TaxID=562 RepID=UPI002033CC6E|nr:hypothetical protein [Escherichia coli]
MQIEKVMSLLEVLSSWLEDNINMDSELSLIMTKIIPTQKFCICCRKGYAVLRKWHLYLQILFMQFDSACSLP